MYNIHIYSKYIYIYITYTHSPAVLENDPVSRAIWDTSIFSSQLFLSAKVSLSYLVPSKRKRNPCVSPSSVLPP